MARSTTTPIIIEPRSRIRLPRFDQVTASTPNSWFAARFPDQAEQYGSAFLESSYCDQDGLIHHVPAYLNDDFFGAMLGGDKRLGHSVVFYPPENTFYFYDPIPDAFCPTTDEKLKLLVSNYLIRCSQESGALVEISNLVVAFRQDNILNKIIEKAKAMHAVDRSFFEGKHGRKRMIDGKLIDPKDPPAHETFIKHALIPEPDGTITVTDCYHKYYRYCRDQGVPPPTRTEFTSVVTEAIRAAFNIGIRHDVPAANGKQTNGWKGIAYRHDQNGPVLAHN